MFLGEYSHSVDDKGRVVMPSKFRHGLGDGLVVTKGQERCLYVFSSDRFEDEAAKVRSLERSNARVRKMARGLFGSASFQALDKAGRCMIPENLRGYAGLDKDVTILGLADRIEIWDTQTWEAAAAEVDDYYANIDEVLSGEGS